MVEKLDEFKRCLDEELCGGKLEYLKLSDDNSTLSFRAPKFCSDFFRNLREYQETNFFCDLTIRAKTEPDKRFIRVHKLVLSCCSPYFKAMFTGGFKENDNNEILIDDENYHSVELIVNFFYTAHIVVEESNVQNLLEVAKMFQAEEVVKACCTYLYLNLDPNNCIGIGEFATRIGCYDLAKKAQVYINEHFCEVSNSEEFLSLDRYQICKIIKSDDIRVACESLVFMAVVKWVKHRPAERRCGLDRLFQCIRVHCLPPKFIKDEIKDKEIFDCEEADQSRQYLQQVFDDLIAHKPTNAEPRRPNLNFGLYVVGGYQRKSTNTVECYKQSTGSWERCADMRLPRSGVSCISLALYIFAIGGRYTSIQGSIDCCDVERYDPMFNVWSDSAPMNVPRSRAGTAVLDNLIYAVGGANNNTFHSSVERYSFEDNKWELVASMSMPRIGLGCAVVRRLLYAIGGYDGKERLSHVECYDPDKDVWFNCPPMNVARSGAGVSSLDNYIYVIGGYTTNQQLNSAERFDTLTNQWTIISSMSIPRSGLSCVTWNGKIYAIGGYKENEFLSAVEVYDPKEDKWSQFQSMNFERSGHGAVVSVEFIST